MSELSPTAQAVLDAFTEDNSLHDWKHNHYNIEALAAALRAAADQLTPYTVSEMTGAAFARNKLLDIAYELEAQ
jgi:hypothetical protein